MLLTPKRAARSRTDGSTPEPKAPERVSPDRISATCSLRLGARRSLPLIR